MVSKAANRNLQSAKAAKQDEFYTQYVDRQTYEEIARSETQSRAGCTGRQTTCALQCRPAGRGSVRGRHRTCTIHAVHSLAVGIGNRSTWVSSSEGLW